MDDLEVVDVAVGLVEVTVVVVVVAVPLVEGLHVGSDLGIRTTGRPADSATQAFSASVTRLYELPHTLPGQG